MSNYEQPPPLPPRYGPYGNGSVPRPPQGQASNQPAPQPYAGNTPYGHSTSAASTVSSPAPYYPPPPPGPPPAAQSNHSYSPYPASSVVSNVGETIPHQSYHPPPLPPRPREQQQQSPSSSYYPASAPYYPSQNNTPHASQRYFGQPSPYYPPPPQSVPYTPTPISPAPQSQYAAPQIQSPGFYPSPHSPASPRYQSYTSVNRPPQQQAGQPASLPPAPPLSRPPVLAHDSTAGYYPPPPPSAGQQQRPPQASSHQPHYPPSSTGAPDPQTPRSDYQQAPYPLPPPAGSSSGGQQPNPPTAPPQQNQYPSPPQPQPQPQPQTPSYQQYYPSPAASSLPTGIPPPQHPQTPGYQHHQPLPPPPPPPAVSPPEQQTPVSLRASYPPPPGPTPTAYPQANSPHTPAPLPQTQAPPTDATANSRQAGQPSYTEAPAPQDPVAGISAQMDKLDMGTATQGPASQPSRGIINDDVPRPPYPVRATGTPLDTVPYCPESRAVDYSLHWYQLPDIPDFLTCTKCHADHVKGTQLEDRFERIKRPNGTYSTCCFWLPRIKEILWPQAVRSGNMDALRAFITKRLDIRVCKGQTLVPASESIKWFGMTNSEIVGFISCEACYEDKVVNTSFESRFSPYRKQKEDEKWRCDLSIPFISRAVLKMAKHNDWSGFVAASTRRLQLPKCEGKEVQSNSCKWFVPRHEIANVRACEACYMDRLELTRFESEFEPHAIPGSSLDSFDALISQLTQASQLWDCKLSDSNLPMMFAVESAIEQRNFSVFQNAASVICSLVPCTANGIIRGNWWTLSGGCENFDICEACYVGILGTGGLDKFFESVQHPADATLVCDFCPASPRFSQYLAKYAEAIDKGVFSYYTDYVRKFATVHACPGLGAIEKRKWWGYLEALFCQDCYLSFVVDTPLGDSVPIKGEYDERAHICQIWSPRMRKMWLEVCAAGNPGSEESQAALKEFRAFGTNRQQVYLATVPQIKFIRKMKELKMQNAMHQGLLSVMYNGMGGMAMVSDTTDGYMHGNSQIGWHETWQGAHGAQLFQDMQSGFANANRMDEWMQIMQLETMWKQVE